MTCKPKVIGIALALALGGCGQGDPAPPPKQPADPEIARIVKEADGRLAGGDLAAAQEIIADALRAHPESPDVLVARARLQFLAGEQLAALDTANRALALGPDNASALLMRALMVRDAHGPVAALPWFAAATAADAGDADAWAEYAATLGEAGRNGEMLAALRKLAAVAPEDRRALYLQAVLAARANDHALARSLLSRSGMVEAGVPAALLLDAVTNLEEGNYDSAVETLGALEQRQPANMRLRELLARALFLGGRNEELVARLGVDAERADASPYLLTIVARGYERLGQRDRAAPLLARAFQPAGASVVPLTDRAGLPDATGTMRRAAQGEDWAAAEAGANAITRRFPLSSDAAALAGDAALGAGDWGGALGQYTRAATVRWPWPLTRKAAFAYQKAGDEAAAEALLRRHVAGEPGGISGIIALAQVEARRGDWRKVAALLDHAIKLGAGNDPELLALRLKAARKLGDGEGAQSFAAMLADRRPPPLAAR